MLYKDRVVGDEDNRPTGGCPQCGRKLKESQMHWNGWAWEHKNDTGLEHSGYHVVLQGGD